MTQSVGLIGLGNAGSSLARALLAKVEVVGFDLDAGRRRTAAELGVSCVDGVAAVAERAERILLSLPKPEASCAVIDELLRADRRPAVVIETGTVAPQTAIDCHARCRQAGIAFVDAAIAGGVASMAAARITFFLGGEPDAIARARPVLDLLAGRIFELGPPGAGMAAKLVNNAVMHAVMVVLIEAFAMSGKLGVPVDTMVEILNREEGLLRPLVHRVGERMTTGDYEAGMSVSNARKDSVLALETAQALGVPLFATLAAHTPYEIAEAEGMGEKDYAALAMLWEKWAEVSFRTGSALSSRT